MTTQKGKVTRMLFVIAVVAFAALVAIGLWRRAAPASSAPAAMPAVVTPSAGSGASAGNPFMQAMQRAAAQVGQPVPGDVQVRLAAGQPPRPLRELLADGGIVMTYAEPCPQCDSLLALRARLQQEGKLAQPDRFWLLAYRPGAALPAGAANLPRITLAGDREAYYAVAGEQVMPSLWRYAPGARLQDYLVGYDAGTAEGFLQGGPGDAGDMPPASAAR